MSIEVIYPPTRRKADTNNISVFLAGSIDMGSARNWQNELVDEFESDENITFYNPRRPEGFFGEQSLENDTFVEQVNWELDNISGADIVAMFITADSKAPISLLEFGYICGNKKIKHFAIAVEKGFYRRGNIEVMCNRFNVPLFEDLDDLVGSIRSHVEYRNKKTFF